MLVLRCQVLPFSWALTLLACCLGLRGSCPVVTLPGVPLWFFRTWLGLGGAPPDIRQVCFLSDCTLKSWPWPRLGVLGIPCLGFSVALLPGASGVSFAFIMVVTLVLWDLPCSSVGGLHCTGPANARQIAWEKVIACGGGQVFLVRLGRRIVGGACRSYCHRL